MSGFPGGSDFTIDETLLFDDTIHHKQKHKQLSGIILILILFLLIHGATLGVFSYFVFYSFPYQHVANMSSSVSLIQ